MVYSTLNLGSLLYQPSTSPFQIKNTHTDYLSLLYKGLIVSGSNDTTICVWDPDVPKDPLYVLVGHQENVCALTVTQSGDIVSGSWDKYATGFIFLNFWRVLLSWDVVR